MTTESMSTETVEIMDPASASAGPFSTASADAGAAPAPTGTLLTHVRVARHVNFDRVAFEFSGPLPGYTIDFVPEVIQDGSGEPLPLKGRTFVSVVFNPAAAHDDDGHPTVPNSIPVKDYALLRDVKSAGDFEGYVSWGLGLAGANGAQVSTQSSPNRVRLDLMHVEPGTGGQLLKRGSKGAPVATWQWRLVQALHRDLRVDEDFGPATEKATKDFQTKRHITADGIVGSKTRAEMRKALNIPNSPPS